MLVCKEDEDEEEEDEEFSDNYFPFQETSQRDAAGALPQSSKQGERNGKTTAQDTEQIQSSQTTIPNDKTQEGVVFPSEGSTMMIDTETQVQTEMTMDVEETMGLQSQSSEFLVEEMRAKEGK